MNKKINELAVKAGVSFDWDPGTSGPEVYFDRQEDFEKFAELIVRECISTMRNTLATQCDSEDEKYGCTYAIMDVTEHFGVEE